MAKYTGSEEADKKIEKDIKIINKIVLKHFNPKAIVMFGGFGHGGGSYKKEKGEIIPLNDYDLYLVTDKKISGEKLERVGEECSEALGKGGLEIVENYDKKWDEEEFFHVDLHNITLKDLKNPYPTQRTADLKTSIVIYGDEKILENIPEIKISKSDAIRPLFNKLDHFQLAMNNSDMLKKIYAVKGFTDLCSCLLIYYGGYVPTYQERSEVFQKKDFPKELKENIKKATDAKINKGYEVENFQEFFEESQKWVKWGLKKILKDSLKIESDDWKVVCKRAYKELPYKYFNDYLGNKFLFWGQYYLNIKYYFEGKRKGENLWRALTSWRDAGLIIAIALILYSVGEKKEAEKYLRKLTKDTKPLKERILKLYSVYYLQKLV